VLSEAGTKTPADIQALAGRLREMGYNDKALELEQQGVAQEVLLKTQQQAAADADLERRIKQENLTSSQVTRIKQGQQQAEQVSQRSSYVEMITNSDMPEVKKKAITVAINAGAYDGKADKLYEMLYPDKKDRVIPVGKGIYDLDTKQFTVPFEKGLDISDVVSAVSPNQHDPASISEFHKALYAAERISDPEERDAAISDSFLKLKDRAKDGYQWTTSYNENNEPVEAQIPMVGTPDYVAYRREVGAANAAAERVVANSLNAIEVADKILNALESGSVSTGITGIALSIVPNTDEANVAAGLDTLKSEMGISQLEAMRAASANGASGFGQLTQMELQRLEDRIRSLSMKQSRARQIENITEIRSILEGAANKAKTNWTVDEWLGLMPRPYPSTPPAPSTSATPTGEVTTSSGSRFVIVPVGVQ
jgi:hypothetical protein